MKNGKLDTINEIKEMTSERIKAYRMVEKCIGSDEISDEGKRKMDAIGEILSDAEFSETIEDLVGIIRERKELLEDLKTFKYVCKWMKHNVGVEI